MSKPIIRIQDLLTNEIIDREMTTAEYKQYQTDLAENTAKAEAEAAVKAKVDSDKASALAKLAALGLTEDEAKAVIGV